jgi:hypothetical protein
MVTLRLKECKRKVVYEIAFLLLEPKETIF